VKQQFGAPAQMSPVVSSAQVHATLPFPVHKHADPVHFAAQTLASGSQKSNSQLEPDPPDVVPHAVRALGGLKQPLPPRPWGVPLAVDPPPPIVLVPVDPPPPIAPLPAPAPSTTTLPPHAARRPVSTTAAQQARLFIRGA
jgi:hypothetical protein